MSDSIIIESLYSEYLQQYLFIQWNTYNLQRKTYKLTFLLKQLHNSVTLLFSLYFAGFVCIIIGITLIRHVSFISNHFLNHLIVMQVTEIVQNTDGQYNVTDFGNLFVDFYQTLPSAFHKTKRMLYHNAG